MKEEDEARVHWGNGRYENERMACETCGDHNAWDKLHTCCKGILNALHAFPFAAWGDVSGAQLDPNNVVETRKVEIGYAEKKPAPGWLAKQKGWKVIKSRWIDINKGGDENLNYRSRMVGK